MSLHHDIHQQLAVSLKARDTLKTEVIRGLLTSFTNEAIQKGKGPQGELSDEEVILVIRRIIKQRQDSAEQYHKGGRPDLQKKEGEEKAILETFVPPLMSEEDIRNIVIQKKHEMKIEDKLQKGLLMGAVMKELKGKADGGDVKKFIDEILG